MQQCLLENDQEAIKWLGLVLDPQSMNEISSLIRQLQYQAKQTLGSEINDYIVAQRQLMVTRLLSQSVEFARCDPEKKTLPNAVMRWY
ncbi:hypothetical protein [Vibrio sp. CAU 1672]|uniref:hypothetical protein n=1 Tax=Vibrio sp. CAU 1672 TaxID=3032594 RepID=UPI0023DB3F6A|nr:hypothetical protein [Vibrio sp. CAU 1672]MDF2154197.1 hypothetical protein [Vibrio sp. CAU 1672]